MIRWIRIGLIVLLVPILGGLVALVIWWLINRPTPQTVKYPQRAILLPAEDKEKERPPVDSQKREVDDLRKIEGIGPKTATVLQGAGIRTYAQLSITSVSSLKSILNESGIRSNPDTWPDQAKLAAVGDWDRLGALQSQLKGGRRA